MLKYQRDAFFVFIFLAFTYAYFYQDASDNGDSRFGLTFAIVQERQLSIDTFQARKGLTTQDKAFYDGHYYSDKAIGTSLSAVIFYLPLYAFQWLFHYQLSLQLTKYFLTFCTIGLISAFAGSLIYILAKHISGNKLWAYIVTISISMGTLCFPYSITFYSHQLAASFLFLSFFIIFRLKFYSNSVMSSFLIGFLMGLSIITEFTTVVIVCLMIFYYFYIILNNPHKDKISSISISVFGGLIPLSIMLLYNFICFDSPFALGYSYGNSQYFRESMAQGIMGIGWPNLKVLYYMTFHPSVGLFWQSPVLIMTLIGIVISFACKKYRIEVIFSFMSFLLYTIMYSGYYMWWGGWAVGIRGIIPVIPLLSIPLSLITKRFRLITVFLAIISIIQMGIIAASNVQTPDDIIRNIDNLNYFQYSTIYNYCLKQLIQGKYAFNVGHWLLNLNELKSLFPFIILCFFHFYAFLVNDFYLSRRNMSSIDTNLSID